MDWKYDPRDETWKTGTKLLGAGVFQDENKWTGNVCIGREINCIGTFDSKEQAIEVAESLLEAAGYRPELMPMKCIICENDLEPVCEGSIAQPWHGGEIRATFGFGSSFDSLGRREMVPLPGQKQAYITLKDNRKIPTFDPETMTTQPLPSALQHENRRVRLLSCSHVLGVICDDCFDKKSHLFRGYEKDVTTKELKLLVP